MDHSQNENTSETPSSINLELLEHTINSISDCLVITDMDNTILFVNEPFIKTYGYSRGELEGKNIDVVRSDRNDPSIYDEIYKATESAGWHGKIFNRKKDGQDFLIELNTSVVKDKKGNPVAKVGASTDLTILVEHEEILKEIKDKYRNLFYELKDAIYESTPEGKLTEINPAGIELFGFSSKEEMFNVDIAKEMYINEHDRTRFKAQLEKDGVVKNYEILVKSKQGKKLVILETASLVRDNSGKVTGYRGILRDITELKKSEDLLRDYLEEVADVNERLKLSEAQLRTSNNEKDKFFSIIAHDLKSPFNSLLTLSQFLVEDIDNLPKEDIKSFATEIHTSSKSVFRLLENLLQWAQIKTGILELQAENIDLYELVERSIELFSWNAREKGIEIHNETDGGQVVYADQNMASSIVQNLISNAIKFSKSGDKITISSQEFSENYMVIVSDTGVGISKDNLKKLFRIDKHHSTIGTNDEIGTGLGLILCKELVEKNGGKIWVESKIGSGSDFYFTLPKEINS
jgi:PAS domain S-box-containing protein